MRFLEDQEKQSVIRPIIKKCHVCGHLSESRQEIKQCSNCKKSFLPLNYEELFSNSHGIHEDDLIKGIIVLW